MGLAQKKTQNSGLLIISKNKQSFELIDGLKIGRSHTADITLDDKRVSRIHLEFVLDGGDNLWLLDCSANGTFIDGNRVNGKTRLIKACIIKAGNTEIEFVPPGEAKIPVSQKPKLKLLKGFQEDFSNHPKASFRKRFAALLIDGALTGLALKIPDIIFLNSTGPKFSNKTMALLYLFSILSIYIFYYVIPLKKNGQTIGKKAMKIRVIKADGKVDISYGALIFRELILKNFGVVISVFTVLFSQQGTAVHDYFTKTRVIELKKADD